MADCCTRCGTPFPVNRDLVSVPGGRSLVVDRAGGHAWRVCGRCAVWELLGPERSGALVAELTARLPHSMQDEAMHHDAVGGTTVVLLPTSQDAPVRSEVGMHRRERPAEGAAVRWASLAILAGALVAGFTWLRTGGISLVAIAATWALLFAVFQAVAYGLARRGLTLQLSGGRTMRIRDAATGGVWIDLTGDQVVVRGLRGIESVAGRDAALIVDQLFMLDQGWGSAGDLEVGWLLLRLHGDLAALVSELLELRPDDRGGIQWREISRPWQAALGLAAAEATGDTSESEKLLARLPKESAVAALARGLASGEDAES